MLADDAKAIVAVATEEARAAGQEVGPAHILVGLAKIHVAFGSFDVYTNDIRRAAGLPVPDPPRRPAIPSRTPQRTGRLVFDGGGDTTRRVESVLGLVQTSTPPIVAFIGAACPWSGPAHALQRAVEQRGGRLVDVGASATDSASEIVVHADVVHLAGGYHRYLVDYLAAGPTGEALVQASDAGAVVWGASAGAIALGVGAVDESGDDGPELYPGLGWIDAAVFPHFQGRWGDVQAGLPAGLNEQGDSHHTELLELHSLVCQTIAARVPDAGSINRRVLVLPHEGAIVADPGWQRFSALPPFPEAVGAWWSDAEQGRRRIA
ncbi:MAG TPA: Type 1 glutamine amidotransferase-like domain-containing protein [Acidimicrobiales bacterium]|nr:Type 1 glutamine amidotransferase-like domain-containing protein [Acidimicrobiales bacterium]